jgi:hypothetical protein
MYKQFKLDVYEIQIDFQTHKNAFGTLVLSTGHFQRAKQKDTR